MISPARAHCAPKTMGKTKGAKSAIPPITGMPILKRFLVVVTVKRRKVPARNRSGASDRYTCATELPIKDIGTPMTCMASARCPASLLGPIAAMIRIGT